MNSDFINFFYSPRLLYNFGLLFNFKKKVNLSIFRNVILGYYGKEIIFDIFFCDLMFKSSFYFLSLFFRQIFNTSLYFYIRSSVYMGNLDFNNNIFNFFLKKNLNFKNVFYIVDQSNTFQSYRKNLKMPLKVFYNLKWIGGNLTNYNNIQEDAFYPKLILMLFAHKPLTIISEARRMSIPTLGFVNIKQGLIYDYNILLNSSQKSTILFFFFLFFKVCEKIFLFSLQRIFNILLESILSMKLTIERVLFFFLPLKWSLRLPIYSLMYGELTKSVKHKIRLLKRIKYLIKKFTFFEKRKKFSRFKNKKIDRRFSVKK